LLRRQSKVEVTQQSLPVVLRCGSGCRNGDCRSLAAMARTESRWFSQKRSSTSTEPGIRRRRSGPSTAKRQLSLPGNGRTNWAPFTDEQLRSHHLRAETPASKSASADFTEAVLGTVVFASGVVDRSRQRLEASKHHHFVSSARSRCRFCRAARTASGNSTKPTSELRNASDQNPLGTSPPWPVPSARNVS
jgi:hypothetical protein